MGSAGFLMTVVIAAFCVGAAIFARLIARRGRRAAIVGWAFCGAVVMALGWGAYALEFGPATAIFTGLILPVWLMGGLVGLLIGTVIQALRK